MSDIEAALVGVPKAASDEPVDWAEHLRGMMLDTAGLDSIRPPEPLIDGILDVNTLAWIHGKPGHAKSVIALDLSGCVGTGHHWHGAKVKQGDVFFIAAEGVSGMRPRTRAWEESHGRKMTGVRWLPYPVQANVDVEWRGLTALAAELRPAMIVIDTQARVTVGLDENAGRDMGLFVDRVERLRRASGATILVVHHEPRNGENMRGHTALEGAATTIIRSVRDGELVTVSCEKQKEGPEFEELELRLHSFRESVVLMPAGIGGVEEHNEPALKFARLWWKTFGEDWVTLSTLDKVGISRKTFYNHRTYLIDAGLLRRDEEGRYPRYRIIQDPDEQTSRLTDLEPPEDREP